MVKFLKRKAPLLLILSGLALLSLLLVNRGDMRTSAVMITNSEQTSGGTGIILRSSSNQSLVLTNAHVCKVVENGGVVKNYSGIHRVVSYSVSKKSDLCLIKVSANLHSRMSLSSTEPNMYDEASISGHPALMPNVISRGHVSGRNIITVFTGVAPCTEEDFAGDNGILCAFFGGLPILKSYESVLVSATIMPGSSGSGVYNKSGELIGVVFAGSGELGYAWTVPYEEVNAFLGEEVETIIPQTVDSITKISLKKTSVPSIKDLKHKCVVENDLTEVDSQKVSKVCDLINQTTLWEK